ncbi:MAG: PAS domain S-box-containing protein [Candidatus Azotimanducaceae bacterium]|jgi:PAS domain S-box-containing protein
MNLTELRRLAEARLISNPTPTESRSFADTQKLLHELQVSQIELEMQNEVLAEDGLASYRHAQLYELAPTGYYVMERNSMVTRTNLQGASQLGLAESAITGRRFLNFVALEHRASFCDCLDKAADTGVEQTCEILVHVNKLILWFHVEVSVGETKTECLVTMVNITPRRLAEERLQNSEARYRSIVQSAHDGILRLDNEGNLLEVNASYCRLSGYSEQELLTMRIADLEVIENINAAVTYSQQLAKAGAARFITQHRSKDGSVFDVEVSKQYRSEDGGQVVAFIHDITHRVEEQENLLKLQREMSQTRRMEALEHLSRGVAHKFNNLLTIITGYTELAQSTDSTPDPSERATYLQTVLEASYLAKGIVSQLLAFSRADASKEQPMNLAALVAESVDLVRSMLPSSINIDLNQAEDLPAVLIDSVQMFQLLTSLCNNARDAMAGAGTLTIDVSFVRGFNENCKLCHQCVSGDWVQLKVTDTGGELTAQDMEHLFEPLYTTKPAGEGLGMGLSAIHGIMGRPDRHVLVTSHPGGTEFRLLFEPLV